MTCPTCDNGEARVTRTIPGGVVARQHACGLCGSRWWSEERVRRGSLVAISSLSLARQQPEVSSDSSGQGKISDPNSAASLQSGGRAKSNQGAEFTRLLAIFSARWERSNRRPYPVVPADRNQLGRFMQHNGNYIEGFAAMVDRYLSDRGNFLIKKSGNHRLSWLLANGLAEFGGSPRESAEQYSARLRREHEARKAESRRPPANADVRDLIAGLAEQKAVG